MINVQCSDDTKLPTKGSDGSAGYDLYAPESGKITPGCRKLIKTGVKMTIPIHMYGRIAPRSGLAYKHGIDVLAGVIDSDYRGDIGVILLNTGTHDFHYKAGDRIAQIIFEIIGITTLCRVPSLVDTERGEGGFGSTSNTSV